MCSSRTTDHRSIVHAELAKGPIKDSSQTDIGVLNFFRYLHLSASGAKKVNYGHDLLAHLLLSSRSSQGVACSIQSSGTGAAGKPIAQAKALDERDIVLF